MYKAFSLASVLLILNFFSIFGQGTGNNPYSRYGLGEVSGNYGSVRNIGMGSSGVASRNHYYINHLNPAFLGNYRGIKIDSTTKLEMAFHSQYRQLSSSTSSQTAFGTNLAYLSAAWPISRTWGMNLGITPFSTVDYNINTESTVNGSVVTNKSEGRGGIYKVYIGNGVGITRWASLGLETGVLYGNVTDMSLSNFGDVNSLFSGFKVRSQFTAWSFKPGISFRKEMHYKRIDTIKIETTEGVVMKLDTVILTRKAILNAGITYDFMTTADMIRTVNLFSVSSANYILDDSTVQKSAYNVSMPGILRAGVSLEIPRRLMVNADVSLTNWGKYGSSDAGFTSTGFGNDTLQNTWALHTGAEYTPGELRQKSKTYRLGLTYTQLPVKIQGKTINDMSVSFGATVPFGRAKTQPMGNRVFPRINLALVVGQRGNTSEGLIKENYFRLYASLLIHETWFQRRRIN